MSGDKPSKRKPGRPPGKRISIKPEKPAPQPKVTEKEREVAAKNGDDLLMPSTDEIACVHLCVEKSIEFAASTLGWSTAEVNRCINKPRVKLYAVQYREQFVKRMVSKALKRLDKVGVTRAAIEARYMELAKLDPEDTKGTITGQVAALRGLCDVVGLTKADPLAGKSDEELEEIVRNANAKAERKGLPN